MIDTELVVSIETFQPLSIESFSYSWLVNKKPSYEHTEESFGDFVDDMDESSSFIDIYPNIPALMDFDFPTSDSSATLVHADELISNGFLVPLFVKPMKMDPYDDVAYSVLPTPVVSSHAHEKVSKVRCSSFRRCWMFSKQIVKKYMGPLTPVFQKFGGRNSGPRTEADVAYSAPTSPRISVAYSIDDWRRSCDYESSIHEAVQHCKRSIGK